MNPGDVVRVRLDSGPCWVSVVERSDGRLRVLLPSGVPAVADPGAVLGPDRREGEQSQRERQGAADGGGVHGGIVGTEPGARESAR